MKHIAFVTLKLLFERKRQTIIAIVGVSIGVAAFIAMASLMNGFQKYFIEQALDLNAHVTLKVKDEPDKGKILKKVYGEDIYFHVYGAKPKDLKDKIVDYKFLIAKYEKDSEIAGIAPHLTGQGIVRYGTVDKSASLIGIDPVLERRASVIDKFISNKKLDILISDRDSVIIGKLLARDLGIDEVGKKVIVTTPNGVTHLFKVVDFFESGITMLDQTRIYMNLKTLQTIMNKPNEVNEIIFKIKDVYRANEIAERIKRETGYYTESWQKAFRNFLQLFKIQNYITYMIVFAILVVSAFGIFNIIMMTVLEKKRDIAILKALGYDSSDIIKIFVFHGITIGFSGALLGCILGYGLQEFLASVNVSVEGLVRTKGFALDRNPLYFLYGVLFAFTFSTFAAFYPSYKASKLNPVDIFRSSA
ncbi:lipoprotein-releasing system permease protein [Thermodesulfovibrio aggregans]|uniref:Lipoprotein-releasing system permease protein n=1 Tax=Thermodesulfovibrio aggregans TaxID=86166 RepID=A0A0U9HQ91_9BACT|nr:ABC transporter permease [Thermodesulfovibrio aggregans]GAQ94338.1 lipoprotein-releasing system permease protein [Thermodesulfovibrio aggregans]